MRNADERVVDGFGDEWSRFDQEGSDDDERRRGFEAYFRGFPWESLPEGAVGFDAGCGSGRWAAFVAPRVGALHCVDASERALEVARRHLAGHANVSFHLASVADIPLPDASADFGYSLGVLHHVPDPAAGLRACVRKLKPGSPFLLYLYYALENRPPWYRAVWRMSDLGRRAISRMPHPLRYATSQVVAASVYWPLARSARVLENLGVRVDALPLAAYRHATFYGMRTDALDRFGTRIEKRFTRGEMEALMSEAGLERIRFDEALPFWCAVGFRAAE